MSDKPLNLEPVLDREGNPLKVDMGEGRDPTPCGFCGHGKGFHYPEDGCRILLDNLETCPCLQWEKEDE